MPPLLSDLISRSLDPGTVIGPRDHSHVSLFQQMNLSFLLGSKSASPPHPSSPQHIHAYPSLSSYLTTDRVKNHAKEYEVPAMEVEE
jgi:hypothetical protein